MDITLTINGGEDTVFLINGRLFEGGDIAYGENEVVYVTVLPLSALLLPYTVKMVGGSIKSNHELVKCYSLEPGRFYVKFFPRFSYVYCVPSVERVETRDIAEKFFKAVSEKKTDEARECLTRELSDSIDDRSLLSFFDGFKDIVVMERGLYYLIDKNDRGVLFNFLVKNTVIDNIVEV
ncbi:MAG: hypothetical protein FWE84_03915 [Firmicutes bacterium]|nr:hypothetical protein [Bacillota bacterium]